MTWPLSADRNADVGGNAERSYGGNLTVVGGRVRDDDRRGRMDGEVAEGRSLELARRGQRLAEAARRFVEVAVLVDEGDERRRNFTRRTASRVRRSNASSTSLSRSP